MRTSVTSTKVKVKVTELPKLGKLHFSVYLLCHFRVELKTDGWRDSIWTWSTACRSPIFEFPSRKAITRVQTSRNIDILRSSNGHISVVRDAVRWLGMYRCPTRVVYVDVTLTRSNVKVKVTDLLKFRKSPRWPRLQPCDCDCRWAATSRACWQR